MTTAPTTTNGAAPALISEGFTAEQVQLIKDQICVGGTDNELKLFLYQAKRMGLDPLAKQIYAIKRKAKNDDGSWGTKMSIQVSIDGFRLIADRTGRYAPGRAATFEVNGKDIISATAYVSKLVAGHWHEVSAVAYWDEYAQQSPMWSRMPRTMLAKCAESLALRKAFPAELSGVYTDSEMDQANEARPEPTFAEVEAAMGGQDNQNPAANTKAKLDELDRAIKQFWTVVRPAAIGQGIDDTDIEPVVYHLLPLSYKGAERLHQLTPPKIKALGARLAEPGVFASKWAEWQEATGAAIPSFDGDPIEVEATEAS